MRAEADLPLPAPVDTMAGFVEAPKMRPRISTRAGSARLSYVDAGGRQRALALSEAQLWALGREVAAALMALRSEGSPDASA